MTGDVVNLRRIRKQRARAEAASSATANRVAFGRTRAEKALSEAERRQDKDRLDGHRLQSVPGRTDG